MNEKNKVTIINEDTFEVDSQNEKIKLAIQDAQANLNYFISELSEHAQDSAYWFSAKIPFESSQKIEHMWIEILEFKDDTFQGILVSEPRWIQNVKVGDSVNSSRANIEDWYISNDSEGIEEGNFTEKYLFPDEQ